MKLDYPALEGTGIEGVTYTLGLGKIGSFAFNVPAGSATAVAIRQAVDGTFSPSEKAPIVVWIYDSTEGLVFKGKIDAASYTTTADGKKMLAVAGPSVAIELQQRTVGLGLQWEDVAFSTAVNDILDDTDWTAGEIDTAVNVPARRMDARQKWDALLALADIYQMLVREDNINSKVDIGAFGESSGLFLTNHRSDIITLDDDPTTIPITSLRVLARANDIVNRVYPVGQIQGLGGAVLTLSGVSLDNPVTTRLYLSSSTAAPISPTYDASWENTSVVSSLLADIARGSDAAVPLMANPASTTNPTDILRAQWVYGPIGAQTISGNVKAQFLADESNADANSTLQMLIRVVASDGTTVRGTLLSHGTYGNELGTTTRNTTFPSTALSSLDALDGDYIVIEVGFRHSVTIGANRQSTLRAVQNDGTADLPEDETTTDDTLNPWIEFSTYIVPQLTADTTYVVRSVTLNGITHYYIEDAESIAQFGLRDRVLNIKDILPLGLSITNLAQASATLYGTAVTYLQRHKDPQVAYEVECVGLRHMRNGTPYFRVGDKLTLDYVGTYTDDDGTLREDMRVRQDLYIMAATRSYGPAGESIWKLTVSTIARALPNDGDLVAAMLSEIGVAKISPLGVFQIPDGVELQIGVGGVIRADGGSYWDDAVLKLVSAGAVGDSFVIQASDVDRLYISANASDQAIVGIGSHATSPTSLVLKDGTLILGFEGLGFSTLRPRVIITTEGIAITGNTTPDFASGAGGVLYIAEAGTAPTGTPASGGVLFVDSSGNLKFRTKGGNTRTVAAV